MLVCVCDKKHLMHFDLYYVCSSVIYHERSLMQVLAEVNKKKHEENHIEEESKHFVQRARSHNLFEIK